MLKFNLCFIILNSMLLMTQSWNMLEGDDCTLENQSSGICLPLDQCSYAINLLNTKTSTPKHCSFNGQIPIVCCPKEKLPGERSHEKCIEYNVGNKRVRGNLIFNGVRSLVKEFPHMAILGFRNKEDISWACGGALISDKYVITAAHCLYHREWGQVEMVRLGDLDIELDTDIARPQDFKVIRIIQHPEYDQSQYYHDIGLVQLDRRVRFNSFIRPACLHSSMTIPNTYGIITGWGQKSYFGERSTHLLKANISFMNHEDCRRYFQGPDRKLKNGIQDAIQICAGDSAGTDTCPGDSGGPIQIKVFDPVYNVPYYSIVGITSFGKGCGITNSMGVYVRIAPYISWIEKTVF